MVTDPYSVLGVTRDADKEEIKRAYRKKAKQYHPDLHPEDPKAAEKMNEINEAYDMLSNPEKYRNRQQESANGNPYGQGYGSRYSSNGDRENTTYGSYGTGGNYGQGGYYGDFGGFGYGDIFGFGGRARSMPKPGRRPEDSEEIKKVVDFICMGRYAYAGQILNTIVSSQRNGRWHYLSGLAQYGMGNQIRALEEIQRALQMEPDNQEYMQAYNSMRRSGTTYQANSEDFQKAEESMHRYCMSFCALQFFCTFCRCC